MKHNNPLTSTKAIQFIALLLLLQWPFLSNGQAWNNASTNNLWYDPFNWTPNTGPGGWNAVSAATISTPSNKTIGIDFNQGNLSLSSISVSMSGVTGGTVTIGNNSSTNGVLNLYNGLTTSTGAGIEIVNNTAGNSGNVTAVIMGSSLNLFPNFNSIKIEPNIIGTGKPVNISTSGGGTVEFTGASTYTGLTSLSTGGGSSSAILTLSHPGGGTLPATNDIYLGTNCSLTIGSTQTLHNVTFTGSGFLRVENNATLTITGKLTVPPGRVQVIGSGKIVYTPGAELQYTGGYLSTSTSDNEFPAVNGPTNVIVDISFLPIFRLHANRTIPGFLTATSPFALGNNNFVASSGAAGIVVTDGTGKFYITNVGTAPVTFPVWSSLSNGANHVTISNGQGLTYGVRVAQGHTPALSVSNNAVNRTWYIEPSATPTQAVQAPIDVSFGYANTHVNAGFNLASNVDVLQYNNSASAWQVGHFNIAQTQPIPAAITNLIGLTETPITIANTGLIALAAKDIVLSGIKQNDGNGYISWQLKMDTRNVQELQLEKSTNGRQFATLGTYTVATTNYIDKNLQTGKNYYRLKVVYNNGKADYSSIIAILNTDGGFEIISLVPTVTNTTTQLSVTAAKKTKLHITITDMAGRVMNKTAYIITSGSSLLDVDVAKLSGGMYYVTATTAEGEVRTVKLIKQ